MSLVSIIIPVYNAERYLAQAINSALEQTWLETEIIIVNDGSTDQSGSIARQFDNTCLVIDKKNAGASAARNTGLSVARGEWIQFLDADDYLRKDKLVSQLNSLKSPNQLAICKTVHFVDNDKNDLSGPDVFPDQYLNDPLRFLIYLYGGFDYKLRMIQPNAFLVNRKLIERAGGWNEQLSLDDDGEFFCRVVLQAERLIYVNEPMNFYRKSEESVSLSGTKSTAAYTSQWKSILLKHNHLLANNSQNELIPYIHTATYKGLQLLKHQLYPGHKKLYEEIKAFSNSLVRHHSRGDEVYGGVVANFIGNRVSWKLLKRIQLLKAIL